MTTGVTNLESSPLESVSSKLNFSSDRKVKNQIPTNQWDVCGLNLVHWFHVKIKVKTI